MNREVQIQSPRAWKTNADQKKAKGQTHSHQPSIIPWYKNNQWKRSDLLFLSLYFQFQTKPLPKTDGKKDFHVLKKNCTNLYQYLCRTIHSEQATGYWEHLKEKDLLQIRRGKWWLFEIRKKEELEPRCTFHKTDQSTHETLKHVEDSSGITEWR